MGISLEILAGLHYYLANLHTIFALIFIIFLGDGVCQEGRVKASCPLLQFLNIKTGFNNKKCRNLCLFDNTITAFYKKH